MRHRSSNLLLSLIASGFLIVALGGCAKSPGKVEGERGPRSITLTGDEIQHVYADSVEVMILQTESEVSVEVNFQDAKRIYDMTFSPEGVRSHTKVEEENGMFVLMDDNGDGLPDLKSEFRPGRKLYQISHSFEERPFPER